MYRVTVTFDFDTQTIAENALSDMEEAAGKHNGDLQDADIENLDNLLEEGE
jgi:hypothetical protein